MSETAELNYFSHRENFFHEIARTPQLSAEIAAGDFLMIS